MKNVVFSLVVAVGLMSATAALAAAQNTTIVPAAAETETPAPVASPTADVHANGQRDYRLSCPYLKHNANHPPTVDNCRTLYDPHHPNR